MKTESGRPALSLEQLPEWRAKTEKLSQFLEKQLRSYLETLQPLLVPKRLFGRYVRGGGSEDVAGADRAFRDLKSRYGEVCGKPFGLSAELEDSAFREIGGRLELYPWEYTHAAEGEEGAKSIRITSPVRWVLAYRSGFSLAELRRSLTGKGERRPDDILEFVLNALGIQSVLGKFTGITRLLADLRYEVRAENVADLGALPLTTVTACLPSFLPADDLLLTGVRMSGVPAFIELIDIDAVCALPDPLRGYLENLLT